MLDMARMRQVLVDPRRRLAHVQSGCRLGDVDGATQAHGLATVLGADADTGVAGLTLGGGFGWLTRRFGWAVDNLEEVELVTADGKLRRAAEDENRELFWALRGGGGNFGVVTRFTFRLHEVGPMVTAGTMVWEATAADGVLHAYRQVTESAPRELSVALTMRLGPHSARIPAHLRGRPVIGIVACHSGDPGVADTLLAPFREIPAQVDGITRKAYVDHQFVLGFPQPAGLHTYWKSEFLASLNDGFFDAYQAASAVPTSPLSQVVLVQLGGAIGDRPADATAMANRDAEYIMLANASWPPSDRDSARHIGWARSAWEALRPYSIGGNYVNAHNADEEEERTIEAYRAGYARLARVKAQYDRDNFFRVNRNISPAS
jgi:FAD/FMN-containing dehydrogenase